MPDFKEVLFGGQAYIETGNILLDAAVAMKALKVSAENAAQANKAMASLYMAGQLTESDYMVWRDFRERSEQIAREIRQFLNLYCIVNKGYSLN